MKITITLPENITIGDLREVQGSLMNEAAVYTDWEKLHAGAGDAISPAGRVLLSIAKQIENDDTPDD